jgi:ABC-2 type transport system ATP-binding protein
LDITEFLDRPFGELSSGQRTRVSLAKALINSPELLLLDEPTASLDPDIADRVRAWLMDYRSRTGASILLSSHNMAEVERLCDRVIVLHQGRCVDQDTPARLIQRYGHESLEDVFLAIARKERSP